jgi:hypothetical protein
MDNSARTEAGCRCFEILTSILEEHEDVYVSLACTARLLAHGAPAVMDEAAKAIEELKNKTPEELIGAIDLLPSNASVALMRTAPGEVFSKVERQMSVSALITAHAFFESVIKDLLRVTIICDQKDWLTEIAGKSVVFGDIRATGIDDLANGLFEKQLDKLSLSGMPAMVGKLLEFCKGNVTTKSHFQNYRLDIERLKALDKLRHDYAHRRTKAQYTLRQADADLRYLTITAIHLVTCIMDAFDLKGQHRPH